MIECLCRVVHPLRIITSSHRALHFPDSAVAPAPPALEVSIGVAPSAFSFFSVRSRWCSITLRFLKYVTCPAGQQHVLGPQLHRSNRTHPATRASAFEFPQLGRASLPCLLVFSYTVDDVVLVEAFEELVASVPALCAGATIGCYEAAILRRSRRRRRGLRGVAEPAHVGGSMRWYPDLVSVCVDGPGSKRFVVGGRRWVVYVLQNVELLEG